MATSFGSATTPLFDYCYDGAGQLASVRESAKKEGTATTEAFTTFDYDALGRRVLKTFRVAQSLETTTFYWEGNVLLGEQTSNAAPREYLFASKSFAPVLIVAGNEQLHLECDHRAAPYNARDGNGHKAWSTGYRAYGKLVSSSEAPEVPFRFAGQYADSETGLYYNRFRYYDPDLCTYTSADPIGLDGGLAAYAYPGDPLSLVDPFGLQCRRSQAKQKKANQRRPKVETSAQYKSNTQRNTTSGEAFATPGVEREVSESSGYIPVRNFDVHHSSKKKAKDAARHAHGGKPKTPPKKSAPTDVRKAYKESQKSNHPESHPDSEHPETHFHDSNKSKQKDNPHHVYPRKQ